MQNNHKKYKAHLDRINCEVTNIINNINKVNNKELRLILDIINQKYYPGHKKSDPKFIVKYYPTAIQHIIKEDFGYEVGIERIKGIKPFKKIVKTTTIGGDGKLHTKIRYRQPF